jgi:Pentapeptide repeats (8 copies)
MSKKAQDHGDYGDIPVWEILVEELIVRYGAGERNFAGVNIIENRGPWADLANLDLRGINLRGSNLDETDLTGSDLTGADLTGAIINGSKLDEAIIRKANLSNVHLWDTSLVNTDMRGSKLEYITAQTVVFCGAKFDYPFRKCVFIGVNFSECNASRHSLVVLGNFFYNVIMPDGSTLVGPEFGPSG